MRKLNKFKVPFEVRATESQDEGIIEGYASVFGVQDSYGTVFDKGCFANSVNSTRQLKLIKVLWNHDWNSPIGKILEAYEDHIGLFVRFKINIRTSTGRDVYENIKEDVINGLSFGFSIVTEALEDEVWHIKEVNLREISPVTFPANEEAEITNFRADRQEETESNDFIVRAIEELSVMSHILKMKLLASSIS